MTKSQNDQGAAIAPILAALETQLAALDDIGAHIAAAYLDAAIQNLKTTTL